MSSPLPLPILETFADVGPVSVVEGNDGILNRAVLRGPCILVNLCVNSSNALTHWDALIVREGKQQNQAITLFQQEEQRAALFDIIWLGRFYIPQGWELRVLASTAVVAGDLISIHGGYESLPLAGQPY